MQSVKEFIRRLTLVITWGAYLLGAVASGFVATTDGIGLSMIVFISAIILGYGFKNVMFYLFNIIDDS